MTPLEIKTTVENTPALIALLPDYTAIASQLSIGRKKPVHTEIGPGTIIAKLSEIGPGVGGSFLDTLVQIAATNRDIYWLMEVIKLGKLRIDMTATRMGMLQLKQAVPALSTAIDKLLELGIENDIITAQQVEEALTGVLVLRTISITEGQLSFDGLWKSTVSGMYGQDELIPVIKSSEISGIPLASINAKYFVFGET